MTGYKYGSTKSNFLWHDGKQCTVLERALIELGRTVAGHLCLVSHEITFWIFGYSRHLRSALNKGVNYPL